MDFHPHFILFIFKVFEILKDFFFKVLHFHFELFHMEILLMHWLLQWFFFLFQLLVFGFIFVFDPRDRHWSVFEYFFLRFPEFFKLIFKGLNIFLVFFFNLSQRSLFFLFIFFLLFKNLFLIFLKGLQFLHCFVQFFFNHALAFSDFFILLLYSLYLCSYFLHYLAHLGKLPFCIRFLLWLSTEFLFFEAELALMLFQGLLLSLCDCYEFVNFCQNTFFDVLLISIALIKELTVS